MKENIEKTLMLLEYPPQGWQVDQMDVVNLIDTPVMCVPKHHRLDMLAWFGDFEQAVGVDQSPAIELLVLPGLGVVVQHDNRGLVFSGV